MTAKGVNDYDITTVSYTHLDVYKRQVSGALEGGTGMKILKCLLMIVTAPVILVLTLFVWLCTGLIYISGLVLGLLLSLIHI